MGRVIDYTLIENNGHSVYGTKSGSEGLIDLAKAARIANDIVTVGTGGDYTTLRLAFAAGKKKIKLISNVTETSAGTTGSDIFIDGNGFSLSTAYQLISSGTVSIFNLKIINTYIGASSTPLFNLTSLIFENVSLTFSAVVEQFGISAANAYIVNSTMTFSNMNVRNSFSSNILLRDCYIVLSVGTYNNFMLYCSGNSCIIDNVIVSGSNTLAVMGNWFFYLTATYNSINNLNVITTNKLPISATGLRLSYSKNLVFWGTGITIESILNCSNIQMTIQGSITNCSIINSSNLTFQNVNLLTVTNLNIVNSTGITIKSAYNAFFNISLLKITNSNFTFSNVSAYLRIAQALVNNSATSALTVDTNNSIFSSVVVTNTITNNGDYNSFRDCSANAIVNALGADYAIFENVTYVTTATDNSGGTARQWVPTTDAGGNYLK